MIAPANMPAEVMAVVRDAVRAPMASLGAPIIYQDAPEFARYWEADAARVIKVVQKIGKIE